MTCYGIKIISFRLIDLKLFCINFSPTPFCMRVVLLFNVMTVLSPMSLTRSANIPPPLRRPLASELLRK